MKNVFFNVLLLLSALTSIAQSAMNYSQPEIGDKVPDITIPNLMNYTSQKATISDFKGKLLILDFWGVHCTTCIREMPELQQIQEKFPGKVQIIMITKDSKNAVDKLYNTLKFFRNIHLPISFSDTILSKLFPYNAFGLHVWIDGDGVLNQKTEAGSYTIETVQKYLEGHTVKLHQRRDLPDFDSKVPFLIEGNGRQRTHVKYYSTITENLSDYAGSGGMVEIDSVTKKPVALRYLNSTIIDLFEQAFTKRWTEKILKTIVLTNDSSRFFPPNAIIPSEWKSHNTWCYEIKLPLEKVDNLFEVMKKDLLMYFNIDAKIKKVKIEYWSLRKSHGSSELLKTAGGRARVQDSEFTDSIAVDNTPLKMLPQIFSSKSQIPVLGRSLSEKSIDLAIHVTSFDATHLNKQLKKFGLFVKKKRKKMNVLVLTDSNYGR